MAQVLYWTVVPSTVAAYTNNATDAAKIKDGLDSASNAATATGTENTSGSTQTVTEQTPASVTAGVSYRIAWTIYDTVATTYGGGTGTYLVESAAFEVPFTSTGALTAQSATVEGTAAHLTLHTSTGALTAQAATVAGTALHEGVVLHESTGALSAQAATVAGTASHLTLHASTGALAAQAATVLGTAAHYTLHDATGALEAQSATVAGTAAVQAYQQIVLSLPTVIDITATTARGRVTATEYA